MYNEEQLYSIALRECKHIGDINFSKLIRHFGSAKNTWEFAKSEFKNKEGIGRAIISEIGNTDKLKVAEYEIQFCEKHHIAILLKHQDKFPNLLKQCDDAPAILYYKGYINPTENFISIVGTRNMTAYGKQFISDFFENAKTENFSSVSGLALGVDQEVHEQSIKHNIPTIAVLAHGFNTLYPAKNKKLSHTILEHKGALVTEFPSYKKPNREHFLLRNRIVAGLAQATIIVESAFGGGSINTATYANNYNREVFALPGKITDKYSQGCNELIYQNKSSSISTLKSLYEDLGFSKKKETVLELFPTTDFPLELTPEQLLIYQKIGENPYISLDDLCCIIDISSHKVLPILLELELLGKIKSFSGRQFTII